MPPDALQVRTLLVNFHVLRDASGLYVVDSGFIGGAEQLHRVLREHGWDREPIRGIIVTHGHLDHILNVASLAKATGAWIAAPRLDADHYSGHPHYHGLAQVTGLLEGIGRPLLSYRPFVPDRRLDDGDVLDVWHGLRAIHLPGHTPGHMGFYCERQRLLFSADLFASFRGLTHFPPDIFNSAPEKIPASLRKALALDLEGVVPNHGDRSSPAVHLERLLRLQEKLTRSHTPR